MGINDRLAKLEARDGNSLARRRRMEADAAEFTRRVTRPPVVPTGDPGEADREFRASIVATGDAFLIETFGSANFAFCKGEGVCDG